MRSRFSLTFLLLATTACGAKEGGSPAAGKADDAPPAPYSYPAPVQGHYEEANLGSFDFVDGIAYPLGNDTVVYVTSKPIASPAIAISTCPMTEARALVVLRDAAWIEIGPDAKNRSKYFSAGVPFGGTSREQEVGGRYWKIETTTPAGGDRFEGSVAYGDRGTIRFGLPVSRPSIVEVRESDKFDGNRAGATEPTPTTDQVVAAYQALRTAALKKDAKALLAAQGFSADTSAKIRGLAGIEDDLARFSDRFLTTEAAGETDVQTGYGSIAAEGANAKGQKFYNYYYFSTCGPSRLVLTQIAENPQ